MIEEIKNLEFDERYDSEEHGTTTLYFTAPKEYLKDFLYEGLEFPEAVSMELSLEYPQNDPSDVYIQVSPTNEEGEDYDWFDVVLSDQDIQRLFDIAKEHIG